jgi:hypothetical protein
MDIEDDWSLDIAPGTQPLAEPPLKPDGKRIYCRRCRHEETLGYVMNMVFQGPRWYPSRCVNCGSRLVGARSNRGKRG